MTKTMTIPQFMNMMRIKEFNKKRINMNKKLYFIIVLVIILSITFKLDNEATTTAFNLGGLLC